MTFARMTETFTYALETELCERKSTPARTIKAVEHIKQEIRWKYDSAPGVFFSFLRSDLWKHCKLYQNQSRPRYFDTELPI